MELQVKYDSKLGILPNCSTFPIFNCRGQTQAFKTRVVLFLQAYFEPLKSLALLIPHHIFRRSTIFEQ